MTLDLKTKPTMKEYCDVLSTMTDEQLAQYMTVKNFEVIKLEMRIGLIKAEIERREGI